jgi:tetratricopeptide (TPR) repeat protein
VIRKRDPRWQSAAERARVAAELIEEAETLTDTSTIASPADLARASLPPPIRVELPGAPAEPAPVPPAPTVAPAPAPTVPLPSAAAPVAPPEPEAPGAGDAVPVADLVEQAARLGAAGDYAAARRAYERVLATAPAHSEALTGLGVLLSRRGLWSDAVLRLRRATESDPGRAAGWYYLGEALNHVDDLAGAQAAYQRAVELEPRNVKALYGLGIVLDRLNRPDEATRIYRRSREAAGR